MFNGESVSKILENLKNIKSYSMDLSNTFFV